MEPRQSIAVGMPTLANVGHGENKVLRGTDRAGEDRVILTVGQGGVRNVDVQPRVKSPSLNGATVCPDGKLPPCLATIQNQFVGVEKLRTPINLTEPKSVVLRIFKRDDRAGRWLSKTGSFRASIHSFFCGKASFAPPIPGKPPGQPKNPSLTRPSSRGDTDSRRHLFRILANPLEFQLIVRLSCLDRRLAPEHSAPALGYLVPAPFFYPVRPGSQDHVQMIRPRFALLTSLRRDLEHNRVRKHLNSKEFRQLLQTALHPFPTVLVILPRVGIQTAQKRPPNTAADAMIHPCLIPRYYCFPCLRHRVSKHLFTF